nr:reverse transcriptase domain-containing protein [Tanacetum cinerariifolium]
MNYMKQLMPNPKNITDPTTVMNMTLVPMAKEFKLNYSTSTNKNHRISSNPRNRQIAQPGMNLGQDRQMQMVGGNEEGDQFRQYTGQNVRNQCGYSTVQSVRNQNLNLNGNGNVIAARAEGNAIRNNGLVGYYRRFIEGSSKIAKPMTKLTQKNVKFEWGDKQEVAFHLLKQKLCSAPILALPEGSEDFIVYCDASKK